MRHKLKQREGTRDYLIELWETVSTGRGNDWFYDYLAAVYKYYYELRQHRMARKVADWIQTEISDGRAKFRNHPIRVLLDATCTTDRRTKSRWAMALRYTWRRRIHWNGVVRYIKNHGGVSGCARHFTQVHPSKERTLRYAGPAPRSTTATVRASQRFTVRLDHKSLKQRRSLVRRQSVPYRLPKTLA